MTDYTTIYALDFDGVICDSAVETAITGWKAARQIWPELRATLPDNSLIDGFRHIRPQLETGYEAILIMCLLYRQEKLSEDYQKYQDRLLALQEEANLDSDALKKLFGETRDHWINENLDEWILKNPLFEGLQTKLQNLNKTELWYIITTKQERFVERILSANDIILDTNKIFGLDRNKSKTETLLELTHQHKNSTIVFVEDRLATLQAVQEVEALKRVQCLFATWGYNSEQQKAIAKRNGLTLINKKEFLPEYC